MQATEAEKQQSTEQKTTANSASAQSSDHVIRCISWISNKIFETCLYKVGIWYVGVIRCVELKFEVIILIRVKGAELFSQKFLMQFYFDGQSRRLACG